MHKIAKVADPEPNNLTKFIHISAIDGSGRFNPGRNFLFEKLGISFINYNMQKYSIACNNTLINNIVGNDICSLKENYKDICKYMSIDLLRIFDELSWSRGNQICIDVHLPMLLRDLKYQKNSRVIYFLRDPRDWLVSRYLFFRSLFTNKKDGILNARWMELFSNETDDKYPVIKALIDGEFPNVSKNLCYFYPSVRELLEDRIAYRDEPNIFFVDYERSRLQPVEQYAEFAKWLSGSDALPESISQEDLEKAAEMGTFEYQTKGKVAEGAENAPVQNVGGWIRKGIVGDWQNHFTPQIKDYFKDQVGDLLIEAGYVKDRDW